MIPTCLFTTYLPITNVFFGQKFDKSKLPIKMTSQKNHPGHKGHVEIDLSKTTKWYFLRIFKLGVFL
jgi:hypothetical protein